MSRDIRDCVKQITNFKCEEDFKKDLVDKEENYYILTNEYLTEHTQEESKKYIYKLGYVCEPKGYDTPIYITFDGEPNAKEFKINHITGILEIQSEERIVINEDLQKEKEPLNIRIEEIKVPVGIQFKLDFVYPNM